MTNEHTCRWNNCNRRTGVDCCTGERDLMTDDGILKQSEREGWRYAKECESEIKRLQELLEKKMRNRIKCRKCGDIIESRYTHDYVACECGAVAVDGGSSYLKRTGNLDDIIELEEFVIDPKNMCGNE